MQLIQTCCQLLPVGMERIEDWKQHYCSENKSRCNNFWIRIKCAFFQRYYGKHNTDWFFFVMKNLRNNRVTSLVLPSQDRCWPNLCKKRPNSCCILVLTYCFRFKINVKAISKYCFHISNKNYIWKFGTISFS